MIIYEEGSELNFGKFDEINCFHIEKSDLHNRLSVKNIKTVEFILFRPEKNVLNFVEAKRTFPDVNNLEDVAKNIENITSKFRDSFQLSNAIWLGKHDCANELPANYNSFYAKERVFNLVLVVKYAHSKDLRFIKEKLKKELNKDICIWKFKVYVMNESKAKERQLVLSK